MSCKSGKGAEYNNAYHAKRQAALPPKPPKPLSQNAIIKRKSEELPLTPEELEIYEAWKKKRTDQHRERRHRIKASEPPKLQKPTQKSALEKSNAGLPLTPEEQELYNRYWERRRGYNKEQYEKRKAATLDMAAGQ